MNHKDYYKVMGLKHDATEKDIKTAYRRLARKYHPDLNKEPDAEEKFKELGEAYDVLRDPEKRKTYDAYMREGVFNQQHARQNPHAHGFQPGNHEGFSQFQGDESFFDFLFGQRGFNQESINADLHSKIQVTLEEAHHGVVKELQFQTHPNQSTNTLRVKIPAGVQGGQQIRLAKQGALLGNKRGDLYLTIEIAKHSVFDLKGNDIYITLPVAPWEVALGATIAVPTLDGPVDLKIPSGSQGGQILRLKGKGFMGKEKGDQYVILKMVTPKPTTDANRELYKAMAKEMPFNPRVHLGA